MTRRTLQRHLWIVTVIYAVFLVIGLALSLQAADIKEYKPYLIFKDLLPLLVAIPAAWLAFAFQRRQSYLQTLRSVFSQTITAVQDAVQYTHTIEPPPTQDQFGKVLTHLSTSIDELRGVFKNIGETHSEIGLYPFESLKEIHSLVSKLGFGLTFQKTEAAYTRKQINEAWKRMRQPFLREFDRDFAAYVDTPYLPKD